MAKFFWPVGDHKGLHCIHNFTCILIRTLLSICQQHQQKNVHRTNSHDHVRKLVEQEGRAARNLVTWSVPVTDQNQDGEYM